MYTDNWLSSLWSQLERRQARAKARKSVRRRKWARCGAIEKLEDRTLLSGDTLMTAALVSVTPGSVTEVNGEIGDETYGDRDVDLYQIDLADGDELTVDIDAAQLDDGTPYSGLDSYVRLFDSTGMEVGSNDNANDPNTGSFSSDSALTFTPFSAGTYYIGISGSPNTFYDPNFEDSGISASTGLYRLQLSLQANQPPVFDAPSYTFTVGDDAASGTAVGTVSATDPDPSDMLSYYVTAGDPGSVFTIDFTTGQISVMDPSPLDGGQMYVLTVEVSDGEATDSVEVTIDVTETNLPPEFNEPSYSFTVGDDADSGDPVGTVTATDPNPSDMLSYSITAGDPDMVFTIDGMTGVISVFYSNLLDGGQEYVLTVEVSDGEATDTVQVTIDVIETNLPPVFDEPSYTFTIGDTAGGGDTVGFVTATDPNPSDMLNFAIVAGDPGGVFAIGFSNGQIMVMDPGSLSDGQQYVLTVEVSDGEATDTVTVTIDVIEGNEPPVFDQPSYSFTVGDDADAGAIVGTVTATDPNPSDMLNYSIIAGDPDMVFTVDGMSGAISVFSPSVLDGGQTYVLTVEVSDGEATDTVEVTIDVIETNLPPVFDEPSYNFTINDDAGAGETVGFVTATDPNPSDMLSYEIVAGDFGAVFAIGFSNGQIMVMDPGSLVGGEQFVLTVEVSDGEATDTVTVTIEILETNLPPEITGFVIIHAGADAYTFQGSVIDESPEGLTITFGGVLDGHSTTVEADGSFSYTVILPPGSEGMVTAQTTDDGGLDSNLAQDWLFQT